MGKSLFISLSDRVVSKVPTAVGAKIRIDIPTGFPGVTGLFTGEILYSRKFEHGTMIIVLNDGYGKRDAPLYVVPLPGWHIVPIWISDCAQSGIMHWQNIGSTTKGPDPDMAVVKAEFIPPEPPPNPYRLMVEVQMPDGKIAKLPLVRDGKVKEFATRSEAHDYLFVYGAVSPVVITQLGYYKVV